MGLWEKMHNPDFNVTEFSNIRNESGSHGFVLSSKNWINSTNAHKDIAFEFASWISAEFKYMALFGKTAKQWRDSNTDKKGNIRDYANMSQLVCLANLASGYNNGHAEPRR